MDGLRFDDSEPTLPRSKAEEILLLAAQLQQETSETVSIAELTKAAVEAGIDPEFVLHASRKIAAIHRSKPIEPEPVRSFRPVTPSARIGALVTIATALQMILGWSSLNSYSGDYYYQSSPGSVLWIWFSAAGLAWLLASFLKEVKNRWSVGLGIIGASALIEMWLYVTFYHPNFYEHEAMILRAQNRFLALLVIESLTLAVTYLFSFRWRGAHRREGSSTSQASMF